MGGLRVSVSMLVEGGRWFETPREVEEKNGGLGFFFLPLAFPLWEPGGEDDVRDTQVMVIDLGSWKYGGDHGSDPQRTFGTASLIRGGQENCVPFRQCVA